MKNRVLLFAAAGALAAGMGPLMGAAQPGMHPLVAGERVTPGMGQMPQGGIGSLLESVFGGPNRGGVAGPRRPNYQGRGQTVAQAKRNARKRRNVLRSKGHFRKAVR